MAGLKKIGYVVNTVTPEQEGTYALKSVLPKEYENKSFVVDMGSGNTKISWIANGNVEALETYGSKYQSRDVSDQEAYQSVSENIKQVPENLRKVCFIIGGVPFKMAKSHRIEKERYTVLKSEKAYTSEDFQDDKSLAGLTIYKAIRETSDCKTFVFDWDANFTIGFLLTLPY
jgi:exopolyphosphatase/pppGpp-phosphohydrolase